MTSVSPAAASCGVAPIAAPSIEALDRMTVNEKLAHFARKDAYKHPKRDGEKVARTRRYSKRQLPTRLTPGSIEISGGNVTRQAYKVIGRPCFGIPTARLLHGREYKVQLDGSLVFARCGECPIKSTCDFICDERLHANEDIREAYREFRRQGDREAFWSGDASRGRAAASALRDLLRRLQAANFTTIDEERLAAHYDEQAVQNREADAKRQREHRDKAQKAVADPSAAQSDSVISGQAHQLRASIVAAKEDEKSPRWLHQIDARLASNVWAVRSKLSGQGRRHGATHIAKGLANAYPGTTVDALRKRIEVVLARLPELEPMATKPSNCPVGA